MDRDELLRVLKDGLRIEVTSGGFTDPNSRTVKITFDGEEIASTYFDVVQTDEYEG